MGLQVMDEAIKELSIECNRRKPDVPYSDFFACQRDGHDNDKGTGRPLEATGFAGCHQNGDYPREKGLMDVTVIFSELSDVAKVRSYYVKATELAQSVKERQEERG